MTSFLISRSEAFLIELAFGGCKFNIQYTPWYTARDFADTFTSWLDLFVPKMDCPDQEMAEKNHTNSAQFKKNRIRKSLRDLLFEYLGFSPTDTGAAFWKFPAENSSRPHCHSTLDQLHTALKVLVTENGVQAEFDFGTAYGEALGLLDDALCSAQSLCFAVLKRTDKCSGYSDANKSDEDDATADTEMSSDDVKRCRHKTILMIANCAEEAIWDLELQPVFASVQEMSVLLYTAMSRWDDGTAMIVHDDDDSYRWCFRLLVELEHLARAMWIGAGMVWRDLRDLPDGRCKGLLPREFLAAKSAGVPVLRAALDIVERELHSGRPEYTPAVVAFQLITGIEPLVKSLWPETTNVADTLRAKLAQGGDADADVVKFASAAQSLYLTYRNVVIHGAHQLETQVNSWGEALYIYSTVRWLVELHDRILGKRAK
jgi:hypothetical protein